jgi:hypothetical protein
MRWRHFLFKFSLREIAGFGENDPGFISNTPQRVDFPRFHRKISTSSSKLLECQPAQLDDRHAS